MIDIILIPIISIGLVILLSNKTYILFGALVLLLIVIHLIRPQPILFYVICGLGGSITESFAIKYGAKTWKYIEPTKSLNIPIWLIPLWTIAGIVVLRVGQILT